MKEVAKILLFNKNFNAKWDDRLDLETCALCDNSCMLGLVKLSNKKMITKKIVKMVYKRMSIEPNVELKLYIDPILIDRLVFLDGYPLTIRESSDMGINYKDWFGESDILKGFKETNKYIFKDLGDKILNKQESDRLKQISKTVAGHGL